jgi:hypothetical protein
VSAVVGPIMLAGCVLAPARLGRPAPALR